MSAPASVSWRAGRSQISHAFHQTGRRDPVRALCGVPLTPLRLAWPGIAKCTDCLAVTRGVPIAS